MRGGSDLSRRGLTVDVVQIVASERRLMLQDRHGNQADRRVPKIPGRLRCICGGIARREHTRRNVRRSARKFKRSGRDGLQANRELTEKSLRGAEVVREPFALTTA